MWGPHSQYYYYHTLFNTGKKGIGRVLYIRNDISKVPFIMRAKTTLIFIIQWHRGIISTSLKSFIIISVMKSITTKFHLKGSLKLIEFI